MAPPKSLEAESSTMNRDVEAVLNGAAAAPAAGAATGATEGKKASKAKGPAPAPAKAEAPEQPAEVEEDGAAKDEELTDAEYLARRMKRKLSDVEQEGVLEEAQESDGAEFEQDEEDGGEGEALKVSLLSWMLQSGHRPTGERTLTPLPTERRRA